MKRARGATDVQWVRASVTAVLRTPGSLSSSSSGAASTRSALAGNSRNGRGINIQRWHRHRHSILETLRLSESVKNPHLRKPKKQLTIRLDEDTIDYLRALAEKNGISYRNPINLELRDSAQSNRNLNMQWE